MLPQHLDTPPTHTLAPQILTLHPQNSPLVGIWEYPGVPALYRSPSRHIAAQEHQRILPWVPSIRAGRLGFSPQPHVLGQDGHIPPSSCIPPPPGVVTPRAWSQTVIRQSCSAPHLAAVTTSRHQSSGRSLHSWRGLAPAAGGVGDRQPLGYPETISSPAPTSPPVPQPQPCPTSRGRRSSPSRCDSPSTFATVVGFYKLFFLKPTKAGFAGLPRAAGFSNRISQQLWTSIKSKVNLGIILSLAAPFDTLGRQPVIKTAINLAK